MTPPQSPKPFSEQHSDPLQPNGSAYESWIGIPPMHHEVDLKSFPTEAWIRGPSGRRKNYCTLSELNDRCPDGSVNFEPKTFEEKENEEQMVFLSEEEHGLINGVQVAKELISLETRRREMPPHLLPFIPYVEKSINGLNKSRYGIKEDVIRVDTIRKWLNTCKSLHGIRCGEISDLDSGSWNGPLWLIDVENGCLVTAPPAAKYVALSYVWGDKAISASTTSNNLRALQNSNGLYEDKLVLPRVIIEAIEIVQSLGIRFLWVDRFCIVQDDGVAKQCQLNAMGSIYANAYFTLVAAQNDDAVDGLYGKRRIDASNTQLTPTEVSSILTDKEVLLNQAMHLMRSKWYSRGWTLQEYLLSKRRVVFHNNTVNWECLCASWHESQDMSVLTDQALLLPAQPEGGCICDYTPQTGLEFECLPWPNMFRYARLVSMFNRRNLTFPEDVFDAFAGILSHLSRSFPGGFISGLPQMCFDAALLWQPWTHMPRRTRKKSFDSNTVLPSWSWAGWGGNMNSESWRSAANYLLESDDEANADQQCSWKTISTIKWSYSLNHTSPRKEVRVPAAFAHPNFEQGDGVNLPLGWTVRPNSKHTDGNLYYHSCDPPQPFRYPIPIRDKHKAHIPPIIASYLHSTTKRGFFTFGIIYRSSATDCFAIDLLTKEEKWAGVLRLNISPMQVGEFRQNATTYYRDKVELIELSEGMVQNQPIEEKSFDEWNRQPCPRYGGLYEFVNVLWVKWSEGIAYREALGRVERKTWREIAKEDIDITLG